MTEPNGYDNTGGAQPPYGQNPQQPYGQTPPPAYGQNPQEPQGNWTAGMPPTGSPQQGYGGAGYGQTYGSNPYAQAGPPPDNFLVWAILSTVFCCLPAGIVSIVYSTQVNTKWATGDFAGAQQSAANAKKWAIWSVIGYAIALVLVVIFYVVVFAVASR
ncbi:MAG: CD225/dispanin family protein [Propionibacteriaceae bacterium]|nr:CD225/dispanin family protein [Micropruina sp.]HBX80211.1 hypothetical protein [Propionibacteriaceae bacterium]HBY21842.1 hypothetical protein [Propionibacteriaceae bacterium]